jgi:hypothetical protein
MGDSWMCRERGSPVHDFINKPVNDDGINQCQLIGAARILDRSQGVHRCPMQASKKGTVGGGILSQKKTLPNPVPKPCKALNGSRCMD